jgi:hypothetical protein
MFLNVIMLAGIGGAAVPLVLHLLSRARYRSASWGAMMFLQAEDARQRQGIRLRQWILLALRMGVVALLAVALARPIINPDNGLGSALAPANLTAVIILDNSASMSFGPAGRSRADQARQAVRQVLATLHRGDQAALIVLGDPAHPSAPPAPTGDLQSIIDTLDSPRLQTTGYGTADMADGLKLAADVLQRSRAMRRELVVVCDRQALNWRGVSNRWAANWRSRLDFNGVAPRCLLIPVGGWESDNVAIESLRTAAPQILAAQPAQVDITIHNYGSTPRASIPLSIDVDGRVEGATIMTVAASASATVSEMITIKSPGSHVITARIQSSDATGDNQLSSAVDVMNPLNVLIIREGSASGTDAASRPSASAHPDYLKLALMPFAAAGRAGADLADVQIASASTLDWNALDSRKYRVVILDSVAALSPAQAEPLEQHVYSGGGLLISPGAHTSLSNFNRLLHRDGAGVLPALLSSPTAADVPATALGRIDLSHPIFGFLASQSDKIPPASIWRYFPVDPQSPGATVLASYSNGLPYLLAGNFGRGRMVLVTSPLNEDWSNLPQTSFYLPLVQGIVRHLAARPSRNLMPGQTIVAQFDDAMGLAGIAAAQLHSPSGKLLDIPLQVAGDQFEGRYNDTSEAGVYTVSTLHQTLHFVVSPSREEADLTPLDSKRWDELSTALGFALIDLTQTPLESLARDEHSPRELWAVLLAAVLALGLGEMLLGRMWSDSSDKESIRMGFAS